MLVNAGSVTAQPGTVVVDCRFSLGDPASGEARYREGHIPGAHYLHLDRDLSGPVGRHGGRHPLPAPAALAARLAAIGIGRDTPVIAYDDARLAFAARLWWLMRSLGYRAPRLLDGGFEAYLETGGPLECELPKPRPCPVPSVDEYRGVAGIENLADLQAGGAVLVDSREPARYRGLEEPIDPVAGHIPGAVNRPWQAVTGDDGRVVSEEQQRETWGDLLGEELAGELVVYCGSGVTACVNLFSLALLGRDATLYAGSWSDWCSHLDPS